MCVVFYLFQINNISFDISCRVSVDRLTFEGKKKAKFALFGTYAMSNPR